VKDIAKQYLKNINNEWPLKKLMRELMSYRYQTLKSSEDLMFFGTILTFVIKTHHLVVDGTPNKKQIVAQVSPLPANLEVRPLRLADDILYCVGDFSIDVLRSNQASDNNAKTMTYKKHKPGTICIKIPPLVPIKLKGVRMVRNSDDKEFFLLQGVEEQRKVSSTTIHVTVKRPRLAKIKKVLEETFYLKFELDYNGNRIYIRTNNFKQPSKMAGLQQLKLPDDEKDKINERIEETNKLLAQGK